jgi:hypothetical protein
MAREAEELSLNSLKLELEERGLSASAAHRLSNDFVTRHPFAQRLGMKRLVLEVESRGADAEDAAGAAGMLIGIEMRDRGESFAAVIRELEGLGLSHSQALSSALSSARVYRDICSESGTASTMEGDAKLAAVGWLLLGAMILSLCVQLVA